MNRWLQLEFIGKGVCLTLLVALALLNPDPMHSAVFFGLAIAGLAGALAYEGWIAVRQGQGVRGRLPAFLLFVLLEDPIRVYAGVLGGMLVGAVLQTWVFDAWTPIELATVLGAGLALGVAFWFLRQVQDRWVRIAIVLVLAAAACASAVYWVETNPDSFNQLFGIHLLAAIPLLYLLTLAGQAEETEIEIGAICGLLGVGLWMLLPAMVRTAAFLVPLAIYIVYVQRIFRPLRAFKHILRGMSYNRLGRHRPALTAYRRALQLDPVNRLARDGLWQIHRDIDFDRLVHDREMLALIDFDLCLDRARSLLMQPPDAGRLAEAQKLLSLVLDQRPALQPVVYYWRAVAHTHAKEFDKAEAELRTVIEGRDYPPGDPQRESVLLACWQLALVQHGELKRRVGVPLLAEPHRRIEAIAAVERRLAKTKDDAGAVELKQLLYADVTEAEYQQTAGAAGKLPAAAFDHEYCLQQGLALLADAARTQRGAEYLRIAARGMAGKAPWIHYQIAQSCRQVADETAFRQSLEMAKAAARAAGVAGLDAENQQVYFLAVKQLAEAAYARGDVDAAIENFLLYVDSEQSGLDTQRLLAELYARKNDALRALFYNDRALDYSPKDHHLLERKDQFYYSVTPAELAPRIESARKWFDVEYCLRKAKTLLDIKGGGPEHIEWACHLLELARTIEPGSMRAASLLGLACKRRGQNDRAIEILESARAAKPEAFASDDEQDGWYLVNKLLGDLYLDVVEPRRPDQAVACYIEYRKSAKSGADTYFRMGRAFELLGDRVQAAKCYQHVTIFEGHPLKYDAYQAIQRLESEGVKTGE